MQREVVIHQSWKCLWKAASTWMHEHWVAWQDHYITSAWQCTICL
jgi:hypothetical protein